MIGFPSGEQSVTPFVVHQTTFAVILFPDIWEEVID